MEHETTTEVASPELKQRVAKLYAFMANKLQISNAPKIIFSQDSKNAKKEFGLTAYYDPANKSVRLFITDRHPTDILRSFAHELIHHWQNEHGALPSDGQKEGHAHYAQKNPVLRQREKEAYLLGNILFRDWQDENRYGPLNENIEVADPTEVQKAIRKTLFDLIRRGAVRSFHRKGTSGDMNPNDFVEEITRKLELELNKFAQVVNNRGNWENQQFMINEMSYKELKAIIMERIDGVVKNSGENTQKLYSQEIKKFFDKKETESKLSSGYYDIGFDVRNEHYCWYWDKPSKKIVMAKGGGHLDNFGYEAHKNFRGRYDVKTKELSITPPEFGAMKITGKIELDVSPEIIEALNKTFNNPKIFYFKHTD